MGKKQRQKKETELLHQHIDHLGKPFGQPHPANALHKKEATQEYHTAGMTIPYPRETPQ
jgi:hypothetical protein